MTSATPQTTTVSVGSVPFGGNAPFALIAGPCVIQDRDHCLRHATRLQEICKRAEVPFVFKSSYDKANRTSISAFRGPGLEDGLRILEEVQQQLGVPVLTDVHSEDQARAAGEVVDILQIPAFLCRQTDLLVECANNFPIVNVKKGQWLGPENACKSVDKIKNTNPNEYKGFSVSISCCAFSYS